MPPAFATVPSLTICAEALVRFSWLLATVVSVPALAFVVVVAVS